MVLVVLSQPFELTQKYRCVQAKKIMYKTISKMKFSVSYSFSKVICKTHLSKMLFSHLKHLFTNGTAQRLENWQIILCESREFQISILFDKFYKNVECMNSSVSVINQYYSLFLRIVALLIFLVFFFYLPLSISMKCFLLL